ncbi:hypothetical protein Thiowin_03467 [Thiorhodovibrio winogradskyi]|uniref:Uncharacterized protein n=1 Tax=Thiorhodovibrio winogradskyi TaxID=77007 RepID=A0ABZ0SBJ7_9GAMM
MRSSKERPRWTPTERRLDADWATMGAGACLAGRLAESDESMIRAGQSSEPIHQLLLDKVTTESATNSRPLKRPSSI